MNAPDVKQTHMVTEYKHGSPLIAARFDPTGRYLFFGAQDHRVWRWLWQAEAEEPEVTEFAAHDSWIRAMAFSPDGATLLTGGYDGRLIWWEAAADTPQPVRVIEAHDGWLRALAVSPDGQWVASCGNDLLVKIWSVETGELVHELSGHEYHVYNVAFAPAPDSATNHLVSGDLQANLIDWDLETGKQARSWVAETLYKYDTTFRAGIGGTRGMAFHPDGKELAVCGITNVSNAFAGVGNPSVEIFSWETAEQTHHYVSKGKLRGAAWGVAIHPTDLVIGVSGGGGGGHLLFWQGDDANEIHQLKLPNTARDMTLHSEGLHVATAHHDGRVRVYKMAASTDKG